MKPLDSEQDKVVNAKAFITARINKVAKVTSYEPMVPYLNGKLIPVLYEKLPRTHIETKTIGTAKQEIFTYSADDAKMYLEWLIAVVIGWENVNEESRANAYNQLCRFVLILADVTDWDKNPMLAKPYDWVERLEEFENNTSNTISLKVQEIMDKLEEWDRQYQSYETTLDTLTESIDERTKNLIAPVELIFT